MIGFVLLWALPALLIAAAFTDLTSFKIPNILPAAMLALFPIFLVVLALLLAGTVALVIGMVLFAIGGIGGGDAKLFAMTCLWLGWNSLLQYTLVAILFGGVLSVILLTVRRRPLPLFLASQSWAVRLADPKAGVPYGIALAVAAMIVLPDTDLFRLVAAAA
jgi:prepilin peptidase CpaA